MEHYLHSLCLVDLGEGAGWYAPAELEDSQAAVSYVVPVDERGRASDRYIVEIGERRGTRGPSWTTHELKRNGRGELWRPSACEEAHRELRESRQ